MLPANQVKSFLTQFNLTFDDVECILITGNDLEKDACELTSVCRKAEVMAPARYEIPEPRDVSKRVLSLIRRVADGDSVTIGNERKLSFLSVPPAVLIHDHLYSSVIAGTSFGTSLSSAYVTLPQLMLPTRSSTDLSVSWHEGFQNVIAKIEGTGCSRVFIHGGGPVEDVKAAIQTLNTGLAFLMDVQQTAAWRAREGSTPQELLQWVEAQLTDYYTQMGRNALLTNEQMTKAGTLRDWLHHVPVIVQSAQRMAANASPVTPRIRAKKDTTTTTTKTTKRTPTTPNTQRAAKPSRWIKVQRFRMPLLAAFGFAVYLAYTVVMSADTVQRRKLDASGHSRPTTKEQT